MGASFISRRIDSISKDEVKRRFNEIWEEARDYYGSNPYNGSFSTFQKSVTFVYNTFMSEREAEDYIADNQEKWGPAMAVIVKEGNNAPYTLIGGWAAE